MEKPGIGIDFGSTMIKGAVVEAGGTLLAESRRKNPGKGGFSTAVAALAAMVDELCEQSGLKWQDLRGIGVACPGMVDVQKGTMLYHPGFGWRDAPLAEVLREQTGGLRVKVVNDGSAAALGEHRYGAGKGSRNMILLTLGTGVGGGIIAEGNLLAGRQGLAGEVGHIPVESGGVLCECGQSGCLEQYCSARGMVAYSRQLAAQPEYRGSLLAAQGELDAKAIEDAWVAGDEAAAAVMERMFRYLGRGIAGLIHLFNPEIVLLGGGIAGGGERIIGPVREKVRQSLMSPRFLCPVEQAEKGGIAGILGAYTVLEDE